MINLPGGWTDSPYVTPDGRRLVFMYTPWSMGNQALGLPITPGPLRPGQHVNPNPWESSDLFIATRSGKGWGEPAIIAVSDRSSDTSPVLDGNTLYWAKTDPPGSPKLSLYRSRYNILRATKWSAPERLPFNSLARDDNPHVVGDAIWFTSERSGLSEIWTVRKTADGWSDPRRLGPNVNNGQRQDQFWVAPDGSFAYWQREGQIVRARPAGTDWGPAERVDLGLPLVGEPSIGGGHLYFVSVDTAAWTIRVMVADDAGGRWINARSVDEQ